MSDAQAEAERIVDGILGPRHVVEALSTMVGMDADDEPRDRLVAALAAAIDHVQTNSDVPDDYSVGAWDVDADTFRALREALSALRQTDGEDT